MRPKAVITGATSGLGAAYARLLAERGHDLLLTGRRKEALESVAADISAVHGVSAEAMRCELSNARDVEALRNRIENTLGLAWLVNNAGFGTSGTLIETNLDERLAMVKVHVEVPLILTRTALKAMAPRESGVIVNVGSLASLLAVPGSSVYCGTKAFLLRFTESVALEAEKYGIRVQALLPGYFRSDFHRDYGWTDEDKRSRGLIRWMDAETVARSSLAAATSSCPRIVHVPGVANKVSFILARLIPRGILYAGARRFAADHGR